ncbi:hypothetical protein RRG08_007237 [Elysia crispata]|uniref:Uncharacterized protein n=1 Tax=Elysia crispata TaxID=231223 RepID=A0AAE0ZSP0_9GAST|nr:hypothetical protein RRG08_007237 [Elysia crispata]
MYLLVGAGHIFGVFGRPRDITAQGDRSTGIDRLDKESKTEDELIHLRNKLTVILEALKIALQLLYKNLKGVGATSSLEINELLRLSLQELWG